MWVVDADEGSSAVSLRGTLCFLRAYIAAVLIEQCQMGKRQSDTAHWYGVEWTLDLTELRELDGEGTRSRAPSRRQPRVFVYAHRIRPAVIQIPKRQQRHKQSGLAH